MMQLESQLEDQETERSKSQRSVRNVDRIVKDMQGQIDNLASGKPVQLDKTASK